MKSKFIWTPWWKFHLWTFQYFVLTGADDPDIAFAPNGNIMARDGDEVYDSYSDWEWADADKSGIILDKYPNVTFEFTALNKHQVVYASIRTVSYEDCDYKVISYEELIR